jgi:antitoxin component of MazEF toxin-antitoxin module
MKIQELKVSRIGNSRGVRLPAATLRRYQIGSLLLMEACSDASVIAQRHCAATRTPKRSLIAPSSSTNRTQSRPFLAQGNAFLGGERRA